MAKELSPSARQAILLAQLFSHVGPEAVSAEDTTAYALQQSQQIGTRDQEDQLNNAIRQAVRRRSPTITRRLN